MWMKIISFIILVFIFIQSTIAVDEKDDLKSEAIVFPDDIDAKVYITLIQIIFSEYKL